MKLSKYLFWLTIIVIPFSFAINPSAKIDLSIIRIIVPLFFVIWLGEALLSKELFIDTRPRAFFFILFLIIIFLSFFWATEQQRAWRKILFIFSLVPLYFITFDLFKKNLSQIIFLKIILFTSLFQTILGIFQFLIQFLLGIDVSLKIWKIISTLFLGKNFAETVNQYSSWLVNLNGGTILRAFGTFPDPHLFSLFIALSLPISWYFYHKTKNFLYLFVLIVQFIAIALSFSRSSYLATIVFLIIIIITKLHALFEQKKVLWPYLFGIFLILIILFSQNPISQRFNSSFNLSEGSNQGRIKMWKASVDIIEKHPWTGVGIGNFSYFIKPSSSLREPIYAHNLFLDFGAEAGIISLFLLILIFFSVFTSFIMKKYNLAQLNINAVVFHFFVIFFIFSLFETPFYSVTIFPLFLIFLAIPYEKN